MERIVAWYPLAQTRWPSRRWLGSTTWVDGARIFARIAPDGDDAFPPILMLHGLVVSGSYFRPIARELDARFRLFVPDLPGFGRSTATAIHDLDEMVRLLDAWMEVHALERVVIVANSLGCQLATLLAVRCPHRVAGLIMVAPTTDPQTRGPLGMMLRGLKDIPRERQSLWMIWIPDFFSSGPMRALKSLMIGLRDRQLERLPAVKQPLLSVAGERDPICPVPWVEHFATLVDNGRSMVIPQAAHAMNYSAPKDLARIIVDLVEARSG